MDTVAEQIAKANEQIGSSGAGQSQERGDLVDKAFGGHAPAVIKSIAHHVNSTPALFGRKNIAELLGIGDIPEDGKAYPGTYASVNFRDQKSFRHISPELKEIMLDLKKELHNCFLQQTIIARKTHQPILVTDTPYFKAVVEPKLKAFDLAGFAAWVPTLNTSFYFEEFELVPGLERFFPVWDMASKTVTVPGAIARLKGRLEGDSNTFTAQSNTASQYQMTAQDCVVHTDITEDLMMDMVPSSGGFERLRREVALGIQRSKEDAIINGDDTTTTVQGDNHMDTDIAGGSATLFNKAFKGLRKRAIANSNTYGNAGASVSLSTYNGMLAKLGKFATEKGDLLVILGPTIGNNVVFGKVPEILTHEKFNANATIINGELPRIYGIDQYTSEWVREDVGAAGVYAAASALTTMIAVKKSRFAIGQRAPMKIWATPSLASSDKMLLTAKERFSFGGVPQTASEKSVAAAINIILT